MRRRWPLLLLLAGGLTFLASLYLPWQRAPAVRGRSLGSFARGYTIDGWGGYGFGFAAGVFAVALVVVCVAALLDGRLEARLPVARCGLLVAYAGPALAVDSWYQRREITRPLGVPFRFHVGSGTYVGVAAAAAVAVVAVIERRSEVRSLSGRILVAVVAAAAALVAFTLPWLRYGLLDVSLTAYASPPTAIAAAALIFLRGWAAPLSLLLVAAAASSLARNGDLRYGAWIALAAVAVLVASTLHELRVRAPRGLAAVGVSLSGAFVATLFLRWQGHTDGWTILGTAAALLALGVAATLVRPLSFSSVELVVPLALFVVTEALELERYGEVPALAVGLGAKLGFACAGLLCIAVAVHARSIRPPADRTLLRLVASLAGAVWVALALVPYWHVLPDELAADLAFSPASWLGLAGIVLSVRLVGAWWRPRVTGVVVFALPVVLLALVVLELIRERVYNPNWGGKIVLGVSLALALLGWLEQRGRLDDFRVPELLRVDRL